MKQVDCCNITTDRNLPTNSQPNSVTQQHKDGALHQERYYDEQGKWYLDIDYSDHNNPKKHKDVPHEHNVTYGKNGNPIRSKGQAIKK